MYIYNHRVGSTCVRTTRGLLRTESQLCSDYYRPLHARTMSLSRCILQSSPPSFLVLHPVSSSVTCPKGRRSDSEVTVKTPCYCEPEQSNSCRFFIRIMPLASSPTHLPRCSAAPPHILAVVRWVAGTLPASGWVTGDCSCSPTNSSPLYPHSPCPTVDWVGCLVTSYVVASRRKLADPPNAPSSGSRQIVALHPVRLLLCHRQQIGPRRRPGVTAHAVARMWWQSQKHRLL